jgi:hypothetical protein
MAKAKFDIKTEATRTLHAGVGAADIAVEAVKEYVAEAQKMFAEVQKSVASYDFEPKALREQATTVITARVEELSTEAKARRTAIEKRVVELQGEAQKLPTRVQTLVTENVGTATGTYEDLVKRGETVVAKLRKQPVKPAAKTTAPKTAPETTAAKPTKSSAAKSTTKKASTTKKTAS